MTVQPIVHTPPALPQEPDAPAKIHWIGWAVYLGVSWTWCIGMFLPVLLVRDYGFWGWVVFAIPNVVGAAAMGLVMKTRQQSRRVVEQHRAAALMFSLVTILFHVFFVSWFVRGVLGEWGLPAFIVAAVAFWFIGQGRLRGDITSAILTLTISVVAFVLLLIAESGFASDRATLQEMTFHSNDLYWLAAVCLFGFALCPYLDLTFHRARLETSDGDAKSAFQTGFGVFFFAMIGFSLWYARFLAERPPAHWITWMLTLLAVHMLVQSAFTVAVHARESMKWVSAAFARGMLLLIAAGVVIFALAPIHAGRTFGGLSRGEFIYRLFLSFYGLVFPAYVLICMVPTRRRALVPTMVLFVLSMIGAIPFYWMAFIERRMIFVSGGLGVVILFRLLQLIPAPNRKIESASVS